MNDAIDRLYWRHHFGRLDRDTLTRAYREHLDLASAALRELEPALRELPLDDSPEHPVGVIDRRIGAALTAILNDDHQAARAAIRQLDDHLHQAHVLLTVAAQLTQTVAGKSRWAVMLHHAAHRALARYGDAEHAAELLRLIPTIEALGPPPEGHPYRMSEQPADTVNRDLRAHLQRQQAWRAAHPRLHTEDPIHDIQDPGPQL